MLKKAKQMPLAANKLRRFVKSKHPYVEHNLSAVVSIIRHSIQNSAAYEDAAKQLKERHVESVSFQIMLKFLSYDVADFPMGIKNWEKIGVSLLEI